MKRLRRKGFSLIEALVAMCVAGCVLPVVLDAFGSIFLALYRTGTNADRAFGAEWWFRLKLPASRTGLSAMPKADSTGKMHFSWEIEEGEYGSVQITLYVADASPSGTSFVLRRVY